MKVLMIDFDVYLYPDGIDSLDKFAIYANDNIGKFIPMIRIDDEESEHPYYIEEEKQDVYLNFGQVESISEEDIILLPRNEFEKIIDDEEITVEFDIEFEDDSFDDNQNLKHEKKKKGNVISIDDFKDTDN